MRLERNSESLDRKEFSVELHSIGNPMVVAAIKDTLDPVRFIQSHEDIHDLRIAYRRRRLTFGGDLETLEGRMQKLIPYSLNEVTGRWNSQSGDTLFANRNLPPLINKKAIDPVLTRHLIIVTDVSGNLGSVCFVIGSIYFYPEYQEGWLCGTWSCIAIGSFLFVVGSFCFLIGSCANFVKNNAITCEDIGLTVNASLYIFANFLFTAGSVFFFPIIANTKVSDGAYHDEFEAESIGLSAFVFGSAVFIVAPAYDLYRAHQLRRHAQISHFSLMVEALIATLYIGGSLLFLIGSIYFIPYIFRRFAVTMFVAGSVCFQGACISSPVANLYRYLNRVRQLRTASTKNKQPVHVGDNGRKGKVTSREEDTVDIGFGDLSLANRAKSHVRAATLPRQPDGIASASVDMCALDGERVRRIDEVMEIS